MTTTIDGKFELAKYPFWEMIDVSRTLVPLAPRSRGRASVVAVKNPQRGDYRMKVWIDEDYADDYGDSEEFRINGQYFTLTRRRPGFYHSAVDGRRLQIALRGTAVDGRNYADEDEEDYEAGPYLDACVETAFDSEATDRYGRWSGNVSDFPKWMGARAIAITPPQTTGGWHSITLDAPGINPYNDRTTVPTVRVNGVWCLAHPLVDERDKKGRGRWGGRWQLLCDPEDLEIARGYGEAGEELTNQPVRPRSQYALRSLHLASWIPRSEFREWSEDLRNLVRTTMGMCGLQGQVDVREGASRRYAARSAQYERMIAARERKGVDVEQDWVSQRNKMHMVSTKSASDAAEMRSKVRDLRRTHDAALGRIEEREEKYESVIEQLFPDLE